MLRNGQTTDSGGTKHNVWYRDEALTNKSEIQYATNERDAIMERMQEGYE